MAARQHRRASALSLPRFVVATALVIALALTLLSAAGDEPSYASSLANLCRFAEAAGAPAKGGDSADKPSPSEESRKKVTDRAKWNADSIEWLSFKTAMAIAEAQLATEEAAVAAKRSAAKEARRNKKAKKANGKEKKKDAAQKKGSSAALRRAEGPIAPPRPLLLLFHKAQCPACKVLERSVSNSMAMEVLSEHFVMVRVGEEEDPGETAFEPQGAYFPRVIFAAPNGTALTDAIRMEPPLEEGHDHFFADADMIAEAMKRTLRLVGGFTTFRGL